MDTERRAFDVMSPDCPSRSIMQRMGDKWTPLVFLALESGPRRFSQLRQDIGGVTPKVLTQTLRSLERDGLLTRTIYPEVPPRVEYELTELGATLLGPLEIIREWSQDHAEKILRARNDYDELNEV
ncbi:helix-turn-helix transcriptional regulator [Paeniglutamicibacter sp. ABSL32-1]|uniref:winged helix-turn-helix transcriptional regulator n=1 Tax=Paeniglutamicibacter quisquiliarum TaxID=2849498 RepID=UPI001C2DC09E|nr:helix-turn-helix domain-containing protein [Paeniglutamicibacter quisquiliarum]MBV1777929.1 helix-turn-helix transcriptional regulator [Paeniglutamicibacter quisquiliarum]